MTDKEKKIQEAVDAPSVRVAELAVKAFDAAIFQVNRLIKDLHTILDGAENLSRVLDEERAKYAPPAANGIH